ncbi:lipoyl(octanoyl) transferase LipB [Parapusillimonas granuli]|uniref:Octanoyltransferase n=1 Tax=Parapusillimonas granuli TaxID=380911 RepID=A0A853FV59_9BURK|nr:lipoyl(octanoyl) transferase LipB [Parapusillimonas granuli]MBB5215478.1 lipoyl(octanoyl) transferase [Parapusillimonas granuli]MEB2400315.1 lipoyl(octanoyl) transferase LipB [Alcaligenaceae bacterium]NYT49855.1 lipoyl(octanoyl) transferase LipB [Parapusillimonas granuli]
MIPYKWLPRPTPYLQAWQAMRDFTESRDEHTPDEIWLAEHAPVYTLGQAGKPEHVLNHGDIEIVRCDRGGQVTYHGPGQVVAYCLVDLRRMKLFVKEYVALLEDVLIDLLAGMGVRGACRKPGAPGVYVPLGGSAGGELAKIAALGIKVRNGCAYHGLALNVDMDLAPFLGINPCGYEGLKTVDLRSRGIGATVTETGESLARRLAARLGQAGQC